MPTYVTPSNTFTAAAAINFTAIATLGIDKASARHGVWRDTESTLLRQGLGLGLALIYETPDT